LFSGFFTPGGVLLDLISQVGICIETHQMITPGEVVLAGVSGGPDSVALLHILHRLQKEYRFVLHAGHLNHMFRGEEAEADVRLVEDLAGAWGIPLLSERIDVPQYLKKSRLSPQEGAREVRYGFFARAARKVGASRVALGHHADDQAETVLLNLIRGAGLAGLAGIPPVREGMYIRPLMGARRAQIEEYCRLFGLPYRVDSSNLKAVYLRNRVRLELIPLLEEKYNPAVVKALNRLAQIARDEDRYLEERAAAAYQDVLERQDADRVVISLKKMSRYPAVLRRRLIRLAYRKVAGRGGLPGHHHVERILEASDGAGGRGQVDLPGGVSVVIRYSLLEIIKDEGSDTLPYYQHTLTIPGDTFLPETGLTVVTAVLDAAGAGDPGRYCRNEALVDMEKLNGPLLVRRRKDGDIFSPLGMGGKMKLKKFLIDHRVPREKRNAIPIVSCGNDIVWVAGFCPGNNFKVTGSTRVCLHIKVVGDCCRSLS
jgi:tRNA(Ile)-lysidine synthase